jgi:hypothetical protein
MAITFRGTKNSLPAAQLPADYAKPAVTEVTDYEYSSEVTLSVAKATVHDADPAVTMANILTNGTIGVNKQLTDKLAADFLGTATVTAHAELVALRNNYQSMSKDSPALTSTAAAYLATVRLYVKAA